jgi:hypothetical protein
VLLSLYLKEKYPKWINGGEFETFSITQGYKACNGSRPCRELADEGTFERRMNGKLVEYRCEGKEALQERAPANAPAGLIAIASLLTGLATLTGRSPPRDAGFQYGSK